mmetsp:Transcript_32289/g.64822  ORF Transcript_32289/g.64822 Transcript_32289/m.64822 type:complete len:130 (+) Transcript_32289:437-826(+)
MVAMVGMEEAGVEEEGAAAKEPPPAGVVEVLAAPGAAALGAAAEAVAGAKVDVVGAVPPPKENAVDGAGAGALGPPDAEGAAEGAGAPNEKAIMTNGLQCCLFIVLWNGCHARMGWRWVIRGNWKGCEF